MRKEMKEYLERGIYNFSLEFEEGRECDIQLSVEGQEFYIVKSCDNHFSYSSMRDAYSTHDFKNACEWISDNAKDFEALILCGYNSNEKFQ